VSMLFHKSRNAGQEYNPLSALLKRWSKYSQLHMKLQI